MRIGQTPCVARTIMRKLGRKMANAQALQAESRVAVLVDCDNTSPEVLEHALRVVAQFGSVVLRRGYGNHATLANKWQEALVRLAFTPCLQYQYASGKNTSDIALALDALEALFDDRADTFCLVTSDSDFAYLCRKLRERGATVHIVGEAKTPDALRNASDQFFEWVKPASPAEPATAGALQAQKPVDPKPAASKAEAPKPAAKRTEVARAYAIATLGWIRKQRIQLAAQAREEQRQCVERESHQVWGRRDLMSIAEEDAKPGVKLGHRHLSLGVRPGSSAQKRAEVIHDWHKTLLHAVVPGLIRKWEGKLGVRVSRSDLCLKTCA